MTELIAPHMTTMPEQSDPLHLGIGFLRAFVRWRLCRHKGSIETRPVLPDLQREVPTVLSQLIAAAQLDEAELIILLLTLIPHLQPGFFDTIIREHLPDGGEFPEFGGVRGTSHRGLLPTGETALFILAGNDLEKRLMLYDLFSSDHFFARERILYLEDVKPGEPRLSGRLILDPDYVELFTTGRVSAPAMSMHFPAQRISTDMEWNDLVLPTPIFTQIRDIEHWIHHYDTLRTEWQMSHRLKPGYRVLFYGPPGTGKTLTATLLGKYTNRDVYRVDLSLVVSKYIGETEKNLANLFDKAHAKNWILFFDEADALFGKRTETRDAHDRYANQEVAFLLQKIEEFDGLVILASNLKNNIDPAFARRFQAMIHFPLPNATERLVLWQKSIPSAVRLDPELPVEHLSGRYELSGAAILNIVQFCSLRALSRQEDILTATDVIEGIRLEFQKEGKLV
ncbi:ATP-binding protein [Spirosoma sp. KCTC 42546]|uniref:ATP-binding protein n=1 Tax=Spirosoma sp. KCTC 42546 TaxID=2520506 RepID=UPI0011593B7D|nr:AAA family ATPase [Spirosoma sp. KCTC 42546]QDK82127.1 ATP-binding protein [Spirosoma sp. KCTC 42546]